MKCLIIDDHSLIREALSLVLASLEKGAHTLEAADSRSAWEQLQRHSDIQLVILDLGLPDVDGMELLEQLGRRWPTLGVVVLSADTDPERVQNALRMGALGYIPKTAPRAVLLNALRLILAGGRYLPPELLATRQHGSTTPRQNRSGDFKRLFGLTERQAQVLNLMMQGKSNKEIGRSLDLAEPTVKIHVSHILRALHARSRVEAVLAVRGVMGV